MSETVIETARLRIRRDRPGDIDAWFTHINTPEATEHLGGVRTREEIAEKFERIARGWARDGFAFMMVELKDGTFLGNCGIGRIETEAAPAPLQGAVQIGWQLRADHWRRGYALEAASAVMDFAFTRPGIEIVYSQTALRNRASWHLMEKLGLERRADLDYSDPKYPPEDNPTIVYAIGRRDWRARTGVTAA